MLEMKDLEEMQTVWSDQDNQPAYQINEDALHAAVMRKARCIEKGIDAIELVMPAMLVFVATVFSAKWAYRGDTSTTKTIAVALLILVAVVSAWNILKSRQRRQRNETEFDQNLLGDLDKTIAKNDYQIARLRSFQWWFMLPMALMSVLNFAAKGLTVSQLMSSSQTVAWSALLGSLLLGFVAVTVEIRWVHLRRRRELQALRDKLTA